jgi:hypothetical protein
VADQKLSVRVRQTIGGPISILTIFVNPNIFAIVDLLPGNVSLTSAYFIDGVFHPSAQLYARSVGDNSHDKSGFHFDNSLSRFSYAVVDAMTRLRCKRVPHPASFPDLALCDFHGLGRRTGRLVEVTVLDADGMGSEVMVILAEVSEDEKNQAFEPWTERCE